MRTKTVVLLSLYLLVIIIITFCSAEWVQRPFSTAPLSQVSYLAVSWPENGTVISVGGQSVGVIIRSIDDGVSWTQVATDLSPSPLYGVASMTVGGIIYSIAVDDAAEIFMSSDAGLTWTLVNQVSGALYGATIGSNGDAYVSGGTATQVFRSSSASGYLTWTSVAPSTSGTLYGISSYDGVNVIAVGSTSGQGRIFYTSTSGSSWTQSTSVNLPTTGTIVYCVDHGSSNFAMAAGLNSYVAKTTDGGATWTRLTIFSGTVTIRYQAISVLGTQSAYVAGSNGQIYRTLDGGSTWSMVGSTGTTLTSLSMKDFTHGVAGGIAGKGVFALVPNPTSQPTNQPSSQPSRQPTLRPSSQPSRQPSSRPSMQPSSVPSRIPTSQPTSSPSRQPIAFPTSKPSKQPSAQPSMVPSSQPSSHPSLQPYGAPTSFPSCQPTSVPSSQPSSQPSAVPTDQPSSRPSSQPSCQPSSTPTNPTCTPSSAPTRQPTSQPSSEPTSQPSSIPSGQPSLRPSSFPSTQPSTKPTFQPSSQPTSQPSIPTGQPTSSPTIYQAPTSVPTTSRPSCQPTSAPSGQPTSIPTNPTGQPSTQPSGVPTGQPSVQPSCLPSSQPSSRPSCQPTSQPSLQPYSYPSSAPTGQPSSQPSIEPTTYPTAKPSVQPSMVPSSQPTQQPSMVPSSQPSSHPTSIPSTSKPSGQPSSQPSSEPSVQPTSRPTCSPSSQPSMKPSAQPSSYPTDVPSVQPTMMPSSQPSSRPSSQPSCQPTSQPTQPTSQPTTKSSGQPTSQPTMEPSSQPSFSPSGQPSSQPSMVPSTQPSSHPTMVPSSQPSSRPSSQPTTHPTFFSTGQPTIQPSGLPTSQPSSQPSFTPSSQPSSRPTSIPTAYIALGEWVKVEASSSSDIFFGSSWTSTNEVVLVGRSFTDGIAAKSTNRGLTWSSSILYDSPLSDLDSFFDSANGIDYFIAPSSTGGIFVSVDNGETWNPPTSTIMHNLLGLCIGSNGNAFAVGQMGRVYYSTLSSSYDTWSSVAVTAVSPPQLNAVSSLDGTSVFTAGGLGKMYKSTDSGLTWNVMTSGTTENLYSLSQISSQHLMLLGGGNVVLRTDDGGNSWIRMNVFPRGSSTVSGSATNLRPPHAISMLSTSITMVGSANGAVYMTKNGGLHWSSETTIVSNNGFGVYTLKIESTNIAVIGDNSGSAYVLVPTPTSQPSSQPSNQPSSIPTSQPTYQPSTQPTSEPSQQPLSSPSTQPTSQPTTIPSSQPNSKPTCQPTMKPSSQPTVQPSMIPTSQPSSQPSMLPSSQPSMLPSSQPSSAPSSQPTLCPTSEPSRQPSTQPTSQPSGIPSDAPTGVPSSQPSSLPSAQPSTQPSCQPTSIPSLKPTSHPSAFSTAQPTNQPSSEPTFQPSGQPTSHPSSEPSTQPSVSPSCQPSSVPSFQPTSQPSSNPTNQPTGTPSSAPSLVPTSFPSSQPSQQPSSIPTSQPSSIPSMQPTTFPSSQPSISPSSQPSSCPSGQPSGQPSMEPSGQPTITPSGQPTVIPSSQPSNFPSSQPSSHPSGQPTIVPSCQPSLQPTAQPSGVPSNQPSSQPSASPSGQPSSKPSTQPTTIPSTQPSSNPSRQPSIQPTSRPSMQPSMQPTSQPTSEPSQQPTSQPTSQPSLQPSSCPSTQPSVQPTSLPTSQPSVCPSSQPSQQPSAIPTSQPSVQPSNQPSRQPSSCPSSQPSIQPTNQPSSLPTSQPSIQPSQQPSAEPSAQPTVRPSSQPSMQPSTQPSSRPSRQPSSQPSVIPTMQPTTQPTDQPSAQPSALPSSQPSFQPSSRPTAQPTMQPSMQPTLQPSMQPSAIPTSQPSMQPSVQPSGIPTSQPSSQPSSNPSSQPSVQPSSQPSALPSMQPTSQPSSQPSIQPSVIPSSQPSEQPSSQPSIQPSDRPSSQPSLQPTCQPSSQPSCQPSSEPSMQPSSQPTIRPSAQPSSRPTAQPSMQPSDSPSLQPTSQPSSQPSSLPTSQPTGQPSSQPSTVPSSQPTLQPSAQPSLIPSSQPTTQPSAIPSSQPSAQPTGVPSMQPSQQPTSQPSAVPSSQPTRQPSSQPSSIPSLQPTMQPSMQPSAVPSSQPSLQPTTQPTSMPSGQPSLQPTSQPSSTPSSQPSLQPTTQPSSFPTAQPSSQPTIQPSSQPSSLPTSQPTRQPSAQPSSTPTSQPSNQPTGQPSSEPSEQPSSQPSSQPSMNPTMQPTSQPSMQPTGQPSSRPSCQPSSIPTSQPTSNPSNQPSSQPTIQPSCIPTSQPSHQPSTQPSSFPSSQPSMQPSMQPSCIPSGQPSHQPTSQPSGIPSSQPSSQPSTQPTSFPSGQPTFQPSMQPTTQPSDTPTSQPSAVPSVQPSSRPTTQPTFQPSSQPSTQPSCTPSGQPSTQPSQQPSAQPSGIPTSQPSCQPSGQPSMQPTSLPSGQPSTIPTGQPSSKPSCQPSSQPSSHPTQQPTLQPSCQPSSQPTVEPTGQPSSQPSAQPTIHPSSQPSLQPSTQPSANPTAQPSYQPSNQPSSFPSSQPSLQPTCQPSAQPSGCPSSQPTSQPTAIPSSQPTSSPSSQPTEMPSMQPSTQPSCNPSSQPSSQPSGIPTGQPSSLPSGQPSNKPSCQPSSIPTSQPTGMPSSQPSHQPTLVPSTQPTGQPSCSPTSQPTDQPSSQPSNLPSSQPSSIPSDQPSSRPSSQPTTQPTGNPSSQPTSIPSSQPSSRPTSQPSSIPSTQPTRLPTAQPTTQPTSKPSVQPTTQPSAQPSCVPSNQPTNIPTSQPSLQPTGTPTNQPSCQPTENPSSQPSYQPSVQPTSVPTVTPSTQPTNQPSCQPSIIPSSQPTSQPSAQPSTKPSSCPTEQPSTQPSTQPSVTPSGVPSGQPSICPTSQPTFQPSSQPSFQPSSRPTNDPTSQPSMQPSVTPSSIPTVQPSSQPSIIPSSQPSEMPSTQPSQQPSSQPSSHPSSFPTCQPSCQPSSKPSCVPTSQPSSLPSMVPTSQPSCQPSLQPSIRPTGYPSSQPSSIPSRQPTLHPSSQPSCQPSSVPSMQPSNEPTGQPTLQPSSQPTLVPSSQPSMQPTQQPSSIPSGQPSSIPTNQPSCQPSFRPSSLPSSQPSIRPSSFPSMQPSSQPSCQPSGFPSMIPSSQPSCKPTAQPSCYPTAQPTLQPSADPSGQPSDQPSSSPTSQPTNVPSSQPTQQPSIFPSSQPSCQPSSRPTRQPSSQPTSYPTGQPSSQPSNQPSITPSTQPTDQPSTQPTIRPSSFPTSQPSSQPSCQPTLFPSTQPSSQPTIQPSRSPSAVPSNQPSSHPTMQPSQQPSSAPSSQPTTQPSIIPSSQPSSTPSMQPTARPSSYPSSQPSSQPSTIPSSQPSSQPSMQPTIRPSGQPTQQPSSQPSSRPTTQPSSQPTSIPTTSHPTSQPSKQPSSQPSGQPTTQPSTSRPTTYPSSIPSEAPITSRPTREGETNSPTSHPTSSPTWNVNDFTQSGLYRQYLQNLRITETKSSSRLIFSSFYYKGHTFSSHALEGSFGGQCNDWTEFADLITRLPLSNAYFSSFSLSSGAYNFESGIYKNNSYSCSNRNIVKAIMTSVNNQEEYSVICDGIGFRVSKCSSGVTICANCKTICRTDWCQAPVESTAITIQPCQSCAMQRSFYQIWNLNIAFEILYPVISFPLRSVITRNSVALRMSIQGLGRVYCRAIGQFERYVDSSWYSPFALKSVGQVLTVSENGNYTLTLTNLLPSSTYDIYCYSEDFIGNGMDLTAIIATRLSVTTDCCPEVVYVDFPQQIPSLSFALDTNLQNVPSVSISMNEARGSLDYFSSGQVNIFVTPNRLSSCHVNMTTLSVADTIPNTFVINGSSIASLSKSFAIFGEPGCYIVSAKLSLRGLVPTYSNQTLTILSKNNSYFAPKLVNAILTKDGLSLHMIFDITTDQASSKTNTAVSVCSSIVTFANSSKVFCSWKDSKTLVASLANFRVSMGDAVSVKPQAVRSLFCVSSLTPNLCQFANSSISVQVVAPSDIMIPIVSISSPSVAHTCDDLEIDVTGSYGSANHPWSVVNWKVNAQSSNGSNLSDFSKSIESYLQVNFGTDTSKIVTIPYTIFSPVISYLKISLSLTNVFGRSNVGYTEISLSSASNTPNIRVLGPSPVTIFRSNAISLKSEVSFPSCYTGSQSGITIRWLAYDGVRYAPSIVSKSNSPSTFYLPPYSLSPLSFYTVQLLVTTNIGKVIATNIVIQVLKNSVVAKINGGEFRSVSTDQELVLDGTNSYVVDFPANSSLLSYSWSCKETTLQYYGGPCLGFNFSNSPASLQNLAAYQNATISRTIEVTLIVTNLLDGSSSKAVQNIQVLSRRYVPQIILYPSASKYDAARSIIFTAKILTAEVTKVYFSVVNTVAKDSSKFLVYYSTLSIGNNFVQQSLAANTLKPGGVYLLQLSATYTSGRGTFAQMTIVMNSPPSGGELDMSPKSGVALSTMFRFLTYNWQAQVDNYPLRYSMQYSVSPTQLPFVVQSESPSSVVRSLVAGGLWSLNYTIVCSVIALDSFGSNSQVNSNIFVLRGSSSRNSTAFLGTLQTLLMDANPTVNPNAVVQVVNAVIGTLNAANCSLATNTICAMKNRHICAYTANTCGPCLPGFIGPSGDSNIDCISANNSFVGAGGTCITNSDCFSNRCVDGICSVEMDKNCPNQCSGHGVCVLKSTRVQNNANAAVQSCKGSNPYCQAECECDFNYFGQDCSVSSADISSSYKLRSLMCSKLLQASDLLDGTIDTVRSTANIVSNLLVDPSIVDISVLNNCSSLLLNFIDRYSLIAGDARVKDAVLEALNKLVMVKNLPLAISSRVVNTIGLVSQAIQYSHAMGETFGVQVSQDSSIRYGVAVMNTRNEEESTTFQSSLSLSSYQIAAGVQPETISVNVPSGVISEGSSVGIALTTFPGNNIRTSSHNLVSGQAIISTSMKEVENKAIQKSKSRRLQSTSDEFVLNVVLQNLEEITYFRTVPINGSIDCLRTGLNHTVTIVCPRYGSDVPEEYVFSCPGTYGVTHNYTCPVYTLTPYCGVWNGSEYIRTDENGFYNSGKDLYQCFVSNYTHSNTTCSCRLTSSSLSLSSVLQSAKTLEVVTLVNIVVTSFDTFVTFQGTPDFVEVTQDVLAFATSCAIFLLLLLGFLMLIRFDYFKHKQHVSSRKYVDGKNESTGTYMLLRNRYFPLYRNDDVQLEAISSLVDYATSGILKVSDAAERKKKESDLIRSFNPAMTSSLDTVRPSQLRKEKSAAQRQPVTIQWFINSVVPVEYTGMPWEIRFQEKLFEFHDVSIIYTWSKISIDAFYTSLYGKTPRVVAKASESSISDETFRGCEEELNLVQVESESYTLRWVIVASRLINIVFWTSVFVSVYFSNNGQCESSRYEENCLTKKTLFGLKNQCIWNPALESACSFDLESIVDVQSLTLMVVIVLFLTMICTEPLWRLWMTSYQLWLRLERIPIPASFASLQSAYRRQFSSSENPDVILGANSAAMGGESDGENVGATVLASSGMVPRKRNNKVLPGKPIYDNDHGLPYNPFDLVTLRLRSLDNPLLKSGVKIGNNKDEATKNVSKTGGKDIKKANNIAFNKKSGNNASNMSLSRSVMTQVVKSKQASLYQLDPAEAAQLTLMSITRYHILRQYHSRQRLHPLRKQLLLQQRMLLESSEEEWGRAAGYSSVDEGNYLDAEEEEQERARQTMKMIRRARRTKYLDRAIWFKAARLTLIQLRSDRLTVRREILAILSTAMQDSRAFQLALDHFLAVSLHYPLGWITTGAWWLYLRDIGNSRMRNVWSLLTNTPSNPSSIQQSSALPVTTSTAPANTTVVLPASYLIYAYYYIIRDTRIEAKQLQDHLRALDRDVDRDTYLLQLFMVEQLSYLPRRFAQAHLLRRFKIMFDLPGYLTNSSWGIYLTMILLTSSSLFMMAYVFVMSLRFGAQATPYWLVIILASVFFEWTFFQPTRLFIKWIWIPGMHIAPTLRLTHCLIREKCKYWMQRSYGMIRTIPQASLIQHTSVACRLARMFPDLPVARILVSLHDQDVRLDKIRPAYQESFMYRSYQSFHHILLMLLCFPWIYFTPNVLLETTLDVWVTFDLCLLVVLWLYILVYVHFTAGIAVAAVTVFFILYGTYWMLSVQRREVLLKKGEDFSAIRNTVAIAEEIDAVKGVKVKPISSLQPQTRISIWWNKLLGKPQRIIPVEREVLPTEAVQQEGDEQDSSMASYKDSKVVPFNISDMEDQQAMDAALKIKHFSSSSKDYICEDKQQQEDVSNNMEDIYEAYLKRARSIQMALAWATPRDASFLSNIDNVSDFLGEKVAIKINNASKEKQKKANANKENLSGLDKVRRRFRLKRDELHSLVEMTEEEVLQWSNPTGYQNQKKKNSSIHPSTTLPGSTRSAYQLFQHQKLEEEQTIKQKKDEENNNRARLLRVWQEGMSREEFIRRKEALYQRLIDLAVHEHEYWESEARRKAELEELERMRIIAAEEERLALFEEQAENAKRLALLKALEMDASQQQQLEEETKEFVDKNSGSKKEKDKERKNFPAFMNTKSQLLAKGMVRHVPRHRLREVLLQSSDSKRRRELQSDESFALDFTQPIEDASLQGTTLIMNPQDRVQMEAILEQKSTLKNAILPELTEEILSGIKDQALTLHSKEELQKLKNEGATVLTGKQKLRLPRHILRLRQQLARHTEELKEADAELAALKERHIPVSTQISRGDYLFEGLGGDDHDTMTSDANKEQDMTTTSDVEKKGLDGSEVDDIVAKVLADRPPSDEEDEGAILNNTYYSKRNTNTASSTQDILPRRTQPVPKSMRQQLSSSHVKDILSQATAASQDPVKALTQHLLSVQGLFFTTQEKEKVSHAEISAQPLRPIDRQWSSSQIDQLYQNNVTQATRPVTAGNASTSQNKPSLRLLQRIQRQAKFIHQEHADTLMTPQDTVLPVVKDAFASEAVSRKMNPNPPPPTEEIPAQRDVNAEFNARNMQRRERKRLKNLQKIAVNQRLSSNTFHEEQEEKQLHRQDDVTVNTTTPFFSPSTLAKEARTRPTIEEDLRLDDNVDDEADFFDDYKATETAENYENPDDFF